MKNDNNAAKKRTLSYFNKTRPYEPPLLEPLPFLAVGKHGARNIHAASSQTDGIDYQALQREYGSPLYVISEDRLRQDFRAFRQTFTRPGIDTRVAYSVKTNYLPAVCSILFEEGGWAEIVSGMEYELVRALGVPGEEVIFNGPHKTHEELTRALSEDAIVNIDNFDELAAVEQIADSINVQARIGIRVSFRYGMRPWTKFGFSDDNGDCQGALERIARHPKLQLELLHNHSGTFLLVHDVYANAADRLIDVARRARNLGLAPTMIDMGGGFPSINTLKPSFDFPGGSSRGADYLMRYAEVICGRLQKARDLFGGKPKLILEPGRAIVDASTQLACTVVAMKDIAGQGRAVIVDAGTNLVPTACYYDHDIDTDESGGGQMDDLEKPVGIYGPLCMQSDMLRERVLLPTLGVGDSLLVSNVGAYCHTQSSQFIQPRPATILLGPDGPELIRTRETWKDVFALDRIPDRLRGSGSSF
jgi:diaminopimelate decarboxylase